MLRFLATKGRVARIKPRARYPYPRHFSCIAFELGTSEFSHPIENQNADIRFSFLVVDVSRSQFRPDHGLPSSHLCLHTTALIVAGGFLPGQPTTGLYLGDVAVSCRWRQRRLRAGNGVLRWRDNDIRAFAKACCRQITGWRTIIGAIGQKPGDRVEKSGIDISLSISAATLRINPCVWRSGSPSTTRRVKHSVIARSEYRRCPQAKHLVVDPNGQITTLPQAFIIRRPVRCPILLPGDPMAPGGVVLMRHPRNVQRGKTRAQYLTPQDPSNNAHWNEVLRRLVASVENLKDRRSPAVPAASASELLPSKRQRHWRKLMLFASGRFPYVISQR